MESIEYKIFNSEDLYNYLVDYKLSNPFKAVDALEKRIKYFDGKYILSHGSENYYFAALNKGEIVAILCYKVGSAGHDSIRNPGWPNWISYCSVAYKYRGKGIASKLSDMVFNYAKDNNLSILSSGYSNMGFKKLKPLWQRLAKKYNVAYLDNHERPEFD